jgi:polyphosphate:AMP phosphotransferase
MFESAELGHTIDKDSYDKELPALREALLDAQFELTQARSFPVILIVSGVDGGGRRESVHLLNEWLDPRHVETHGLGDPSDEERDRPEMWRFWRHLPPKGKVGIFQGSWYSVPFIQRVYGEIKDSALEAAMERNVRFEKMLTDEGALIAKFWFHLSKREQRRRLKEWGRHPSTRWRATERDWRHWKRYDDFVQTADKTLRLTSTAQAPWYIIDGTDERYRALTMGRILLEALRRRLAAPPPADPVPSPPSLLRAGGTNILRAMDLGQSIPKKQYGKRLEDYQGRLATLLRDPRFQKRSVVAVFEGNDAAGKGGAIRRVSGALDARNYQVIPVAAPTEEERAQPYLWRFWRHLPRRGRIVLFDRSWYGRVLVERVEGFCSEYDWMRAYSEINDFEDQLGDHGVVVAKFWLAISQEEQLRRFQERERKGFKRFKITKEDWRNREKWGDYERAVCDMVDRTSTNAAPWILVEANDKNFARLKVLRQLCEAIEGRL